MRYLEDIDELAALALDEAPDGRRWRDRPLRRRRRIMAACVSMMPPAPTGDPEEMAAWQERAQHKCGSVILTIVAAAVLSWLVQRLCDWLYKRWRENHENAEWSALRTESCLLLQQDEDD